MLTGDVSRNGAPQPNLLECVPHAVQRVAVTKRGNSIGAAAGLSARRRHKVQDFWSKRFHDFGQGSLLDIPRDLPQSERA